MKSSCEDIIGALGEKDSPSLCLPPLKFVATTCRLLVSATHQRHSPILQK